MSNKIGKQYGNLLVESINCEKSTNKHTYYNCKCICGNPNTIIKRSDNLNEHSSCGCIKKNVSIKSIEALRRYAKEREKTLIGQRFGKLTVIGHAGKVENRNNANLWKCLCDCGNITFATTSELKSHHVKSCGCLHSYIEMLIASFLEQHKIAFKQEYVFSDLINIYTGIYLRFDFALFDENKNLLGLIEYNGEQHYNKNSSWYSELYVERDKQKIKYCENNNIPLLILNKDNFSYEKILIFYTNLNKNVGGGG